MMNNNQGLNNMPSVDANSNGNRYYDVGQEQTTSYLPPAVGSEVAPWTVQQADNHSTENGNLSNTTYHHQPHVDSSARNSENVQNTTSHTNLPNLGSTNVQQEYNGYSSYPTSTNPYGHGSAGYQSYYGSYQQQPNNSYTQPVGAYQNNSYTQPVGAYQNTGVTYQNTGASYQTLSSFQNTGSYAGPSSYSSTYYNPTDYQTSGGYPSNGYTNQTTSWNDTNYANYTSHQYPSYTSDTTSAYSSSTSAVSSLQYQQPSKQWADYYGQTEVTCAPGTENLSVTTSTSNQGYPFPGISSGYTTSTSQPGVSAGYPTTIQPSPTFTSSWKPESSAPQMHSLQPGAAAVGVHDGYRQHEPLSSQNHHLGAATVAVHDGYRQYEPLSSQNHHPGPVQQQFQKSVDSESPYDPFQVQQQPVYHQGTNSPYPGVNQVTQSYQAPLQTLQSSDAQRVSKLQIPTNPRIASNLTFGLSKSEKDGSTTSTAAKPAYISVSLPKQNDAADSTLNEPGTFPKSLRGYAERALARCKNDTEKANCQAAMKEIITQAKVDGTLYTRDWDAEPLVPLSNSVAVNNHVSQDSTHVSSLAKFRKSPSRRSKSRWEPLQEEKPIEKLPSGRVDSIRFSGWHQSSQKQKKLVNANSESKEDGSGNSKCLLAEHNSASKNAQRPVKKQRLSNGFNAADSSDVSSDSDKEQSLTAYYSGTIALNDSAEVRRRENRSKRFERIQGHQGQIKNFKPKNTKASNVYTRPATTLVHSKTFEDTGSRAVEDMDWDSLTVKGTCQELEKCYLRLTSAPDPSTVRPEEVLEKALVMVQNSQKNYLYKCDQLKSIRQDLTVQRIRNHLTAKVYETHARLALQFSDLPEYNQCASQLKSLYGEGIEGCHMEFAAYNLLCVILHSSYNRELLSSMSRLSDEAKKEKALKHALSVRAAVTSGNYVQFFRLYKKAPNLNTCLMDLYVEKMRYKAVSCMARSFRPTVPVSYIAQVLGFTSVDEDTDGVNECVEWLKAHGACLVDDNNGETQLDAKASSSCLYIPEPEDAVAHGDANLAVNDFFARSIS